MPPCRLMRPKRSNPGSIFVVFRGCIARVTRLAVRSAEPLFLLAGAVLSRVRRLCRKTENRSKSTKNRSDGATRTSCVKKARFFRSRTRLGVDFVRLGALPDLPGRSFWRPGAPLGTLRALPGHAGDVPRCIQDAFGTLLGATGRPESIPGPFSTRFWMRFCAQSGRIRRLPAPECANNGGICRCPACR